MKTRIVLAAVGAALVFGCGGADQTDVNPMDDPGWTPEHPDYVIYFDEYPDTNGPEPSTASSGETLSGDVGQSKEAFSVCWTGPGWAIDPDEVVNHDNVPKIFGPCYEGTPAPFKQPTACVFPAWNRVFNVGWNVDLNSINANATVGRVNHPEAPGRSIIGDAGWADGFAAWKGVSGIKFTRVDSGPSISILVPPPSWQDSHTNILAVGNPWGTMTLQPGAPPQYASDTSPVERQNADGANYPLVNPTKKYLYGLGALWVYDRNINNTVQFCGGTTAQKAIKMQQLAYVLSAHELGHILGLTHVDGGIMRRSTTCADLGNGSQIVEQVISPGYSDLFNYYESGLGNPNTVGFPDPSQCESARVSVPISITQDVQAQQVEEANGNSLN